MALVDPEECFECRLIGPCSERACPLRVFECDLCTTPYPSLRAAERCCDDVSSYVD